MNMETLASTVSKTAADNRDLRKRLAESGADMQRVAETARKSRAGMMALAKGLTQAGGQNDKEEK